jgi:hypothetical protein
MAIIIAQKIKGVDITYTIKENSNTAYNLTGVDTITLYWRHSEPPIYNSTDIDNKSGTMSVVSATAGTCKYTIQDGDFNWHGKYTAEILLHYTSTKEVPIPELTIIVTPRIIQTT